MGAIKKCTPLITIAWSGGYLNSREIGGANSW